jgi:hypothetical protein
VQLRSKSRCKLASREEEHEYSKRMVRASIVCVIYVGTTVARSKAQVE